MQNEIEAILFDMGGTLRGSIKKSEAEKHAAIQKIIDLVHADANVEEDVFGAMSLDTDLDLFE